MKLFLCEKPSQAADISRVLGQISRSPNSIETREGVVTWGFGHLLRMFMPEEYDERYKTWRYSDLPIMPASFQVRPEDKTKTQFRAVGDLIKKASEIVVATDADAEGEMIARELLDYFNFRGPVSRLWLRATDPESVRKGLSNLLPGNETERLYYAALARSRADWVVGMNMSRAFSLRCASRDDKGGLSIGRVQTPTLALVVRRDREIDNFTPRSYFEIVASVQADNGASVTLKHAPDGEERLFDGARAESIASAAKGVSGPISVRKEQKRTSPPKLFSLARFQMRTNVLFGWSAEHALSVAQSLYETHKATSYPRTTSVCIPKEQIPDIPTIVGNLMSLPEFSRIPSFEPQIRKTVFDAGKAASHHAIIPTTLRPDLSRMNDDERAGFLLIARSYLATLLPDYLYESTKISMQAGGVEFSTTGAVPISPGWKMVFSGQPDADDEKQSTLPAIPDGSNGTVLSTSVEAKKTQPPAYYTEATLLADMIGISKFVTDPAKRARLKSRPDEEEDEGGIGTPATRASIISNLIKVRRVLENRGKKIVSTMKGRALIEAVEKHIPALADPGETAVWEEGLEKISEGTIDHPSFVAGIGRQIAEYVSVLEEGIPAPEREDREPPSRTATEHTYKGMPVLDGGAHWIFEAVKGYFPKTMAQRPMSIEDYIAILSAPPDAPHKLTGFVSTKTKKKFEAAVKFNPRRKYQSRPSPGVEFVF